MPTKNSKALVAEDQKIMKDTSYSISQLAKEYDVTPRAIRFYEDQGLLAPTRKGRQRVYSERDRVRLKLTLRAKRIGFSLSEVKTIFDLYDSDPGEEGQLRYLIEMLHERRGMLEQQRLDIDIVLKDMDDVEKRAKDALKAFNKKK